MKQKRLLPLFLCLCLLFVLPVKVSAADNSEQETSAAYLREQGIMVGDGNGEMNLDSGLTRAQLATVLTACMETQSMCRSIRHSIPDNVNSRMCRSGPGSMLVTAMPTA